MADVDIKSMFHNVPPGDWIVNIQALDSEGKVVSENHTNFNIPTKVSEPPVVDAPVVVVSS